MPYPLLTGRVGVVSTKSVGTPVVVAVLVLAGLITALYVASGTRATDAKPTTPVATVERIPPAPIPATPDLTFHTASIRNQLITATEQLGRAERNVAGLIPELTHEGLWTERRRAEAAVASCETAKQAVERALAELHIAIPERSQ